MLHRTEGIVLKTDPFGEADLIVTYLTSGYGIVRAFAKSPRKIKSRFGSSLEPLTHSRISFWGKEDAALPRLTQSDIIHSFDSIRGALKIFLRVSEIVELTLSFMPEREASKKVYSLLMTTLHAVDAGNDTVLLFICHKVKLLEIVGYLPGLSDCGRCGRESDAFYLSHGTVLCEKCSKGHGSSFRISAGAVNLCASLTHWSFSKISRLKPSVSILTELSLLLDEHLKYIMDRNLKTKTFRIS
jgi:DNA repair protein RecO (recombination protein O)